MPWATTRPCGWSGIARSTAPAPTGAAECRRRRAGPYRPTASLEMSADEQPHSGRGRRAGHHRPGGLSPRAGRLPGLHRGHRPGGAQGGPRGAAGRRGARPDAPGGVRLRGAPRAPPAPRHRGRRRHPAHRAPRGGRPDQGALARRRRLSHQAVLPPGAHPPGGRGASPARLARGGRGLAAGRGQAVDRPGRAPGDPERRRSAAHRDRVQAPAHPGGAAGPGADPAAAARDGVGRAARHPDPDRGHARPAASRQAGRGGRPDRDGPGVRLSIPRRREMTLARRLVAGTVVVLLGTVLVLVVAAERSLRGDLERDVGASLEAEARLVRAALPADSLEWPAFVTRFGTAGGLRVTLIDRSGRVRADTDVPAAELPTVENHAGRPEVMTAFAGRTGTAKRRSATIGSDLMYVAVAGGPGIVRVALPLDRVDAIVHGSQRSVLMAALLAIALGSILSWAAGRSIARPLTETAEAAHAIAAGLEPRFPHSGIPDVEAMVTALRGMHEELDARFEALRQRQAETEALVNAMVEGVLSCDARGGVVTANPAARRLLGYGAGRPLPELQILFHQKAAREVVDATLRGETVPDREVLLDERTCLLSGRPLPGGGAVVVLHDLTDVRRLETIRRDFVGNVPPRPQHPAPLDPRLCRDAARRSPRRGDEPQVPRNHPVQFLKDAAVGR